MGRIEAILLAAGYSSRMGRLKPLLPIGGTTVIRRQAEVLAGLCDRTIVVTGYRGSEVEAHLSGSQVTAIRNPAFAEGMFTSVKAGIMALDHDTDAFLILPVDYPLVTRKLIGDLIEEFLRTRVPVIYPSFSMRKGHPPVISSACIPEILAYQGDMGLKGALKPFDSDAAYFTAGDETCIIDMDTPEDYERVLAIDWRSHAVQLSSAVPDLKF